MPALGIYANAALALPPLSIHARRGRRAQHTSDEDDEGSEEDEAAGSGEEGARGGRGGRGRAHKAPTPSSQRAVAGMQRTAAALARAFEEVGAVRCRGGECV